MKTKLITLILLLCILSSACVSGGDTGNDTPGDRTEMAGNSAQMDPLDGTAWKLLHYRKTQVSEDIIIRLIFEKGDLSGSSGCNSYSGPYQINGSGITVGPIATTLMACMDPSEVMEIEHMYQEWLLDAQTFTLREGQLMIFRSDGEALTFIPSP